MSFSKWYEERKRQMFDANEKQRLTEIHDFASLGVKMAAAREEVTKAEITKAEQERILKEDIYEDWIDRIAKDSRFNSQIILDHLIVHINEHQPTSTLHEDEAWVKWMAGIYNLVSILEKMEDWEPLIDHMIERLYAKWLSDPYNHTPPPQEHYKKCQEIVNEVNQD